MIAHLNISKDIIQKKINVGIIRIKKEVIKKEKSTLQITIIKVRLFFWNLSPINWYDTFKEIHIDMNEFIFPKNKKL